MSTIKSPLFWIVVLMLLCPPLTFALGSVWVLTRELLKA